MNIAIRSDSLDYFHVSIEDGNARINLGLLNEHGRTEMAINLIEAAQELLPTPCDRLTEEVKALASQCDVAVVPASHSTVEDLADALRELHDFSDHLTTRSHAERSAEAFKRAAELLERMGK